uniref:Uncharacterized protein n=2 Tax=Sus scrofa TaxID=9823 RepID=A0A8D0TG28_PIG
MAPATLLLVVLPWPAARGLLRNWWEQLQRKLQHNRLGLPIHPWGPALAVQGPAIFTEPAKDTNGNEEISSLLDSIFWMAAPQNRCSIEVNRCRRRNPQKLIKVKNNTGEFPSCQFTVFCQFLLYSKVTQSRKRFFFFKMSVNPVAHRKYTEGVSPAFSFWFILHFLLVDFTFLFPSPWAFYFEHNSFHISHLPPLFLCLP